MSNDVPEILQGRIGIPMRVYMSGITVLGKDKTVREAKVKDKQFQELCSSLAVNGLQMPISVTDMRDSDGNSKPGQFKLIDGAQRFAGADLLDWEEINVTLFEGVTDEEILTLQLVSNLVRVVAKPAEEGKWLMKWFLEDEDRTIEDAENILHKKKGYIKSRLRMTKLDDDVQAEINAGQISISNAVQLAKLTKFKPPHPQMAELIEHSKTDTTEIFAQRILDAIKVETNTREGGKTGTGTAFRKPISIGVASMFEKWQKMAEGIKAKKEAGEEISEKSAGYFLCLGESLQIDDASWETRVAEKTRKDDEKAKKKADRDKAKADKAAAREKAKAEATA